MRIAGGTIRRNYLRNYTRNYSDKYNSENKISTNRQFQRASQNPISAATALRVRKSLAELETSEKNLNTAGSIYQVAESSMMTISGIIQNTYEKLVEGAHGTRNEDDLEIIAKEVENYAEEMVQSLNVDVSDRKIFGGLNNDTVAFKIERSATGDKYITYNGVAINSSSDPESFPYSGTSYLDIGIGMSIDEKGRIDDQTALPITFNGAECTGCGVKNRSAIIHLDTIKAGAAYKLNVSAGGQNRIIEFNGGDTDAKTIENINAALKEAFQLTPEISTDGSIKYLNNAEGYTGTELNNYKNIAFTDDNAVDLINITEGDYYSLEITANGKTRVIDFQAGADPNKTLDNVRNSLKEAFGDDAPSIYSDGRFRDAAGKTCPVQNAGNYANDLTFTDGNQKIDLTTLTPGSTYTFNINGVEGTTGTKITFTAGNTVEETIDAINKEFAKPNAFGPPEIPYVTSTGTLVHDDENVSVVIDNVSGAANQIEFSETQGYPNNIMQLVLDAAKALREGDQQLVARYADLIYDAQGSLSIAIAELGTNDKFIEFNQDRISEIKLNLQERQNDLEITDLPSEITNWKVLESVYNATLQMGASVVSMSIFDYIK